MENKNIVTCGMVQPRYGRYGKICGWDCIVTGLDLVFHSTKSKALAWMKNHGYEVVG
jgi:hypothetical protein